MNAVDLGLETLEPGRMPIIILSGAPMTGKSTWRTATMHQLNQQQMLTDIRWYWFEDYMNGREFIRHVMNSAQRGRGLVGGVILDPVGQIPYEAVKTIEDPSIQIFTKFFFQEEADI